MPILMRSFETLVKGKWILAGEHAVLRGSPALVFPLNGRSLRFSFHADSNAKDLDLKLSGENGEELRLLVWGVVERACVLKNISRQEFKGSLHIQSNIPIGAGLGASAALCVAITRWFESEKLVESEEVYEFSKNLENLFHGESSGVDIAVALSGKPIRFVKDGPRTNLNPQWTPRWFLSYSGKRGVTLDCVNKVKELHKSNPVLAQRIDQDMQMAVAIAEESLSFSEERGLPQLKKAIDLANSCFERWGLEGGPVKGHIQKLTEAGAWAVKPTGSGDGGFVLSLWKGSPPSELLSELIPCF